jgi:uncharacterized protein
MRSNRRLILSLLASACLSVAGAVACAAGSVGQSLKVVVYGGNGAIGSRIVNEALARGHVVTVVDRSLKAGLPANPKLQQIVGDVFSSADIGKNIAGQDVLITAVAVRPTPTRDFYVRMVKAAVEAQRAQQGGVKKTRLLIVGGASSLNTPDGKRVLDTLPAAMPKGSQNEIRSMVEALDYMRTVTDTSWTFFSPAMSITPGTRTGKFRVGTDQLIVDGQGRSAISMEDFAVAMLGEIEKPQYVDRRFTAGY